jgi:hypothetical protein
VIADAGPLIALALHRQACRERVALVIMDDRCCRAEARRQGLPILGTAAVVGAGQGTESDPHLRSAAVLNQAGESRGAAEPLGAATISGAASPSCSAAKRTPTRPMAPAWAGCCFPTSGWLRSGVAASRGWENDWKHQPAGWQ